VKIRSSFSIFLNTLEVALVSLSALLLSSCSETQVPRDNNFTTNRGIIQSTMSSKDANKRICISSGAELAAAGTTRSPTSSSNSNSPSSSRFLLTNLPSEVYQRVVCFSDFSERMALALTCKKSRNGVEEHEKRVYEEIKRKHRVDETFDERIGDQTNIQTTITKRQKPVDLPWRYRKTVAMKRGLYTVSVAGQIFHCTLFKMILSPSEDRTITIGGPLFEPYVVHICNLSTREHVATLVREEEDEELDNAIFIDDTHIISSHYDFDDDDVVSSSFLLWALNPETNEWESEFLYPPQDTGWPNGSIMDWFRTDKDIICFVMDRSDHSQITVFSLSIDSRVLKTLFTIAECTQDHQVKVRGVSDNKWLLFSITGNGIGDEGRGGGFYVYNLETNQESDFLEETVNYDVYELQQAVDCSKTYFTMQNNVVEGHRSVVSFRLGNDGRLRQHASFLVSGMARWIVAASQSHMFLEDDGKINVYNSMTGRCYGSLDFSNNERRVANGQQVVISKRRGEFFVAQAERVRGITIEAFCLKEPIIM